VNGEVLNFNSIIDALNFMPAKSYELVTSNIVTEQGENAYYYLLQKRK